ncbi:uncharacterized protein DS421_11g339940 [Arachis hypogaea]|nr:uncharacterized protein DS421_11g339940 [Arachis hypogaea]
MAEGCNDRCEDSGSKQYDGTCLCSLAVVALKSKTNANPERIKTRIANIFNRLMNWKSNTWLKRRNALETTNLCYLHMENSNRKALRSCSNKWSVRT